MKETIEKIYTDDQLAEAERIVSERVVHNDFSVFYLTLGQSGNSKDVRFVLYRLSLKGSPYQNPFTYHGPLADDLIEAAKKAKAICGSNPIVIDFGKQNVIKAYTRWTPDVIRFGKHSGVKLSEVDPKYLVWVAKGCPVYEEKYGGWVDMFFGGPEFQLEAQKVAIEKGLGVMHNERFMDIAYYEKVMERERLAKLENNAHHETDKARIELKLTVKDVFGYESAYGYVKIYKMTDDDNRVFTYKGSKWLCREIDGIDESVKAGDVIMVKGTIKHGTYKEQDVTYIQRPKIV